MSEQERDQSPPQVSPYVLGMRVISDFGVSIAMPVVIFAYAGYRIDQAYHTKPWFIILGFLISAILSAVSVYRKAKRYGRMYKKL